jgi:hypothetical protein
MFSPFDLQGMKKRGSVMEWKASVEKKDALLTIEASGVADAASIKSSVKKMAGDPALRSSACTLCDFRKLDLSRLTGSDVQQIYDVHAPLSRKVADKPIAVVVSRSIDFGMARMWEAFAGEVYASHKVFYTIEEAMGWLRKWQQEKV